MRSCKYILFVSKHELKCVLCAQDSTLEPESWVERTGEEDSSWNKTQRRLCLLWPTMSRFCSWRQFGLPTQITFNPLPSHNKAAVKIEQTLQPHSILFIQLENKLHVNGSYCGFVCCKRDIQLKHQLKTHLIQLDLLC